MTKVKTQNLQGASLDWAVAIALEVRLGKGKIVKVCQHEATTPAWVEVEAEPGSAPLYVRFSPSTDWAQGGPLVEMAKINLVSVEGDYNPKHAGTPEAYSTYWVAEVGQLRPTETYGPQGQDWGAYFQIEKFGAITGPTPLIAAMRALVASQFGGEVEVPENLKTLYNSGDLK